MELVTGNSNHGLALEIHELFNGNINVDLNDVNNFSDGETKIVIERNMRGRDVFVIQPTCNNDSIVELLLLIHTLRLASAKRITVIVPYYGYARQDRKTKSRTPISAAAIATLIESMKPHRILTVDLHCGQIQGFFRNIPVDHLSAENLFVDFLIEHGYDDCTIISPDAGGVSRATSLADIIGTDDVVTIVKRRNSDTGDIESMQLMGGDIQGRCCVIIDDIIDTAGTLTKAACLLKENSASEIICMATHGVFSGKALERIESSPITRVCVTNSIDQTQNQINCRKLDVISLGPLLKHAIEHIHHEKSLSSLFHRSMIS